ncbi:hypothetical protein D3P07_22190 [Paenibacillus sp. 1011MAR3C5]|uniref:hypothetical protein n=1 Tax=Paenibacillus sp. 1011MAR3C5 TaxID=1675787 RepID=UPI000E6C978C|nr:hypothetical protein [Paenibacillus sp. 1011MAR3C5]RJE84644.1 hypothetical protein D3P07_22190 [Paenibacillus sp. 1011MAR3C5]
MTGSRVMKWVTGSFEILLGIPLIGGAFILSTAYVPLGIMLILHVVTLILSASNKEPKYGSILGIVTSVVAWIPFVGMALHIITGILLMVTAAKKSAPANYPHPPHVSNL